MSDLIVRKRIDGLFEGLHWRGLLGDSGARVWDLLSALRGPDNDDDGLKLRTSWRLRMALAPEFFSGILGVSADLPDKPGEDEGLDAFDANLRAAIKKEYPTAQRHFLDHYVGACWVYWKYYHVEEGE